MVKYANGVFVDLEWDIEDISVGIVVEGCMVLICFVCQEWLFLPFVRINLFLELFTLD